MRVGLTLIAAVLVSTIGAAAQARPLDALLARDAAQQARFASDVAHDRIDVRNAAYIARQEGALHRLEAKVIGTSAPEPKALDELRQAQYDMAGAIRWAEKHRAKSVGRPTDVMHLRVATTREAEQDRLIAREFKQGQLKPANVGSLEAAQARIAKKQFDVVHQGGESVQAALSIQGLQDVQDYAIRKDPALS